MPSFLGNYPNCASDRTEKFIRAVESFLQQQRMPEKELVIISDGCEKTISVVEGRYEKQLDEGNIILIKHPRQNVFTGAVRQAGIDKATGDVICNLDTDDIFLSYHLFSISVSFLPNTFDWCYWNHLTKPDNIKMKGYYSDAYPKLGSIGNGNIAWKRGLDVTWNECDGVHDNQLFIKQLLEKYPKHQKIYGCGYVIKHVKIEIPQEKTF